MYSTDVSNELLTPDGHHVYNNLEALAHPAESEEMLKLNAILLRPSESASQLTIQRPGLPITGPGASAYLSDSIRLRRIDGKVVDSGVHLDAASFGQLDELSHGVGPVNERVAPAIKGVATHEFFEYASHVAVVLMKKNFPKVRTLCGRRLFQCSGLHNGLCNVTGTLTHGHKDQTLFNAEISVQQISGESCCLA
jgi:hypothetical protein